MNTAYPVEIKTNVEPQAIDAALLRLGLNEDDGEPREIYFCARSVTETGTDEPPVADAAEGLMGDTASARTGDASLSGVVLRVRRDAESADSTVKFRPLALNRLPASWQEAREGTGWEFRIEQDWSTAALTPVLSASLVADLDPPSAGSALGTSEATALFTSEQSGLFETYTGVPLEAGSLRLLGPVQARKWKVKLGDRKVACEEWAVGPHLRFLELSDREDEPTQVQYTLRHLLDLYEGAGIQVSADAETKTKVVMDYFLTNAV